MRNLRHVGAMVPYWESINIFVKIINGIELKHSKINSLWRTGSVCLVPVLVLVSREINELNLVLVLLTSQRVFDSSEELHKSSTFRSPLPPPG